jgi:hypothetical protein
VENYHRDKNTLRQINRWEREKKRDKEKVNEE